MVVLSKIEMVDLFYYLDCTVVVSMDDDVVSMLSLKPVLGLVFAEQIHFDMVSFFSDIGFVLLQTVELNWNESDLSLFYYFSYFDVVLFFAILEKIDSDS